MTYINSTVWRESNTAHNAGSNTTLQRFLSSARRQKQLRIEKMDVAQHKAILKENLVGAARLETEVVAHFPVSVPKHNCASAVLQRQKEKK